ncbi:hypothetical protein U1Q18_005200 [Sarracenia purpurea var. burkii]
MGEAHKNGVAGILVSIQDNHRTFLHKSTPQTFEFFDSEQLDLSLGLSLGGCYSQIPGEKPLIRTSSLNYGNMTLFENEGEGGGGGGGRGFLSLARSSSLPTEAEQELRKLKELQALKRMEAKKRLMEKQRHSREGSSPEVEKPRAATATATDTAAAGAKLSNWAIESASRNSAFCRAMKKLKSNFKPSANLRIKGPENSVAAKVPKLSRPAVTSKAVENGKSAYTANYCSAPVVVLENPANGKHANPGCTYPDSSVVMSFRKRTNGKRVETAETKKGMRRSKKVKALADSGVQDEAMMEMLKLMPSVITTGDGPNGKKIEGFLYRYMKGQVRIVCVCHGNFLSPAEFVKHAGGTDVENPMKHITVLPGTL